MATAYVPLANITLGSSASSVTFSSISQTYKDLVLVMDGAVASNFTFPCIRFNGDTASNYSVINMVGNGSTATSSQNAGITSALFTGYDWGAGNPANLIINVMDYSATDKHKSLISRSNVPAIGTSALAQRWASTAAVTSLVIFSQSGNLSAGGSYSLYGVSA